MKDTLTKEFLETASDPLVEIATRMSNEVVGILADRIKACENLTDEEIKKLSNIMRVSDMKKIEKALEELTGKGEKEIEKMLETVAKENEELAREFYEYRNVEQIPFLKNDIMKKIIVSAQKHITEDFLHISDTTTMQIKIGNEFVPFQKGYNKLIDSAVFATQQGATDYYTAIRKTLSELGENGVVQYESGYRRRIDSAVRMNVLDGVRQMNLSMREQQAKEFGADGWEISAHALCRPDHQDSQGRIFTQKEFEQLNETLKTPIAMGEMNCHHQKIGVIIGINEPAYTEKELQTLKDMANEETTFHGLSGKEITKTRYECSQYLRQLEVKTRDKRNSELLFQRVGDKTGYKKARHERAMLEREYNRIAKEMGLTPRKNRLRYA